MPNTYKQLYIQAVFTVQNRECLISGNWEDELYKYITGIVRNEGHKMLAINGMPDHVHMFVNMQPIQSISKL
jgi:REP element-mobilizing transposase RayT